MCIACFLVQFNTIPKNTNIDARNSRLSFEYFSIILFNDRKIRYIQFYLDIKIIDLILSVVLFEAGRQSVFLFFYPFSVIWLKIH